MSLVSRNVPYLGITGVNPLSTGVTALYSMNDNVSDATNSNDPTAAAPFADPQGSITAYCMANGLYKLTARQVGQPYRPGEIQVTTPDGCEVFAEAQGLFLTGSAAEAAPGGVSVYFSVGLAPGAQIGALYNGVCDPQINVAAVTLGWAGCAAAGGTRVFAVFAGGSVWHASDVSWRVTDATGNPTLMSGGGYAPLNNSAPQQWCMQASQGPFTLIAYDNNVASAANNSVGWCVCVSLRARVLLLVVFCGAAGPCVALASPLCGCGRPGC